MNCCEINEETSWKFFIVIESKRNICGISWRFMQWFWQFKTVYFSHNDKHRFLKTFTDNTNVVYVRTLQNEDSVVK